MSFKFPSFDLKSIQDSLPTVDQFKESFSKVNAGKTVEQFKESIQPFTAKTGQLIQEQLKQVQQLASSNGDVEVSELPEEYLQLETNCDFLLKLYTDLIQYTDETYGKLSYDYPPGSYAINKIKDANVSGVISNKFNQLKNVSSPQELEKVLFNSSQDSTNENNVTVQPTSPDLVKTLYGQLSAIAIKHSEELKTSENPLSFALLQVSSTYHEIAVARLDQDKKIMAGVNSELVSILNQQFIKVNELRKQVYYTRSQFDLLRAKYEDDPENEDLIIKEDELVNATEVAVLEMKKFLRPSKNIDLLKIFITAQKEFFELNAKRLTELLSNLNKIPINGEDEEDD
ncbi:Protein GVP36 [Spathaspora sp. JA1]|nr:Protein GVP36 [Spathaspora sp. JA1]